jgi:transposase
LKELGKTMGLSIRVFIVENDDTTKSLPLARYERLLRRDPDERLSRYAGQRVRYALIVVNLVNRKPIAVVKDEFGFLFFDDEGQLKLSELET